MPYRVAPGHNEVREVRVGTQSITWSSVQGGLAAWLAWAALFSWLALMSQAPENAGAEVYLGGAMVALGIVPALIVTHLVSQRTRQSIRMGARGIFAQDHLIVDFDKPLDACVLTLGAEAALVIRQNHSWLILFGSDIETALGGPELWGPRWHELGPNHLLHHATELEPGSAWPVYWSVKGAHEATIAGDVHAEPNLRALADRVRTLAERDGALLVVPAADSRSSPVRIDVSGTLTAFGERIETHEPFELRYVWAYGKQNARNDADAIVVTQADHAVCLSVTARPGGWPALGALPSAAPEFPSPELASDQVLRPIALAALHGYLTRAQS